MKFPVVLIALACSTLTSCTKPASSLQVYYDVPEFQLISQDGKAFDSKALQGKIWVADFMYTTCPGPCPRMTSQMKEVRNAVEKIPDVRLVSFSVDPEHDTPAVLAAYAQQRGAAFDNWYFLTGPPAALQTLDRDVFKLGNIDASLEHSTRFTLVDRQSRIRAYYDTSESQSIPKLIEDIRALAREHS